MKALNFKVPCNSPTKRPLRLHNQLRTRSRPVGCVRRLDRHHGLGQVADLDLRRDLALDDCREQIKGKNVVCVLSGSNNDIMRTAEIKERSLMYEGLKHYFIVDFPQRAGALREFLGDVLGPDDDITYFEYSKKTNKDLGPALIGLELKNKEDIQPLLDRMKEKQLSFEYVNDHPKLFRFIA